MDIGEIIGEVASPCVSIPTKSAIYVWGYNQSEQTGRNDGEEKLLRIPKQLPPELFASGSNSRWLDISCGREHTAAVASDGSLFTWGANEYGQLGDGTEVGRKHPKKVKQLQSFVSCGAFCTAAIAEPRENKDGSLSVSRLCVWGQNQGSNLPRLFPGAFPVTTVCTQLSSSMESSVIIEEASSRRWSFSCFNRCLLVEGTL